MPGGQSTGLGDNKTADQELFLWIWTPYRSITNLEVHPILGEKETATIVGNLVIGLQNVHTHHTTLMAKKMTMARRGNSFKGGNSRSPDIA